MGLRLGFGIVLGSAVAAAALGQTVDEYQVKAVFLYNFAKFVQWPPQTFKSPTAAITICILGQSPIGSATEQVANGKLVDGRPFVVRQVAEVPGGSGCHILFVSLSERRRWRSMVADIKGSGILTVGETDGFASDGGVINFKLEDGKVRIQINVDAAEREKLQISSKLLSLAEIVRK